MAYIHDKWQPYKPLTKYPHMGPNDAYIWNEFVVRLPQRFRLVLYDARVGEVAQPPLDVPENVAKAWDDLCRLRVDVVAQDDVRLYAIEVRPRASSDALGNALGYALHFTEDRNPSQPVVPCVITDVILPNTQKLADAYGVILWTP